MFGIDKFEALKILFSNKQVISEAGFIYKRNEKYIHKRKGKEGKELCMEEFLFEESSLFKEYIEKPIKKPELMKELKELEYTDDFQEAAMLLARYIDDESISNLVNKIEA